MQNDSRKFRLYSESDKDSTMSEPSYYDPASFKRRSEEDSQYRKSDYDLQTILKDYPGYFNPTSSAADSNEILGIPSFLRYPHDLGINRRYHHFIVFNIYQGDSDSVRLEQRKQNQVLSVQQLFGGVAGAETEERILRAAGVTGAAGDTQYDEYLKLLRGLTDTTNSVTTDSVNFAAVDETIDLMRQIQEKGFIDAIGDKQFISGTTDVLKSTFEDVKEFLETMGSRGRPESMEIYNQEANRVGKDVKGISKGKSINREAKEQNILLANRRFGYANVRSKDTVCLYMPLKIQFNDQLIYSEEDMGSMRILLDSLSANKGGINALIEKAGTGYLADGVATISSIAKLEAPAVQAARNAGTRSVTNPRREAMFRDVGLRTHSFAFEFAPKNSQEAQEVLHIIKMFRYHAYPALRGGGGHFFRFPAEFEAQFYTLDGAGSAFINDNLPKLPRLALTNISVDYSGAGDYKTFYDAKPAFIRMELQFQEMEQLNNEHIVHGY
jgi:hypothetical protein